MGLELVSVHDVGDDRLRAVFEDEDGEQVEVFGWVSATTNHYDADCYWPAGSTEILTGGFLGHDRHEVDHSGHLRDDAKPRQMTPAEIADYARSLLPDESPSQATEIPFE